MGQTKQVDFDTSQRSKTRDANARYKAGKTYAEMVRICATKEQPETGSTALKTAKRRRGKRGNGPQRQAKRAARRSSERGSSKTTSQWREDDSAATRSDSSDSGLGRLLRQQNKLLSQLSKSMEQLQRAVAVIALSVSNRGHGRQQRQQGKGKQAKQQGPKGGRGDPKASQQGQVQPTWRQARLCEQTRLLLHQHRADKALVMVKVASKIRVAYINSIITTLVAQSLQEWVHNRFKDNVLMKITPHATMVAAAEFSGSRNIMHKSKELLTVFAELGADHAHDICTYMDERFYEDFPKELQAIAKVVHKTVSNPEFKRKLCTINCLWELNWKWVLNPHAK